MGAETGAAVAADRKEFAERTHFIKVRREGDRMWAFLGRNGTTRLRIHALRFTEASAARLIEVNRGDNPDWEFKAVPVAK